MSPSAVLVGSGPNGLAAAVTLAEAGWSVRVLESADTIGGGLRTGELTLPGFRHDVCSAIHPMALASPFFASAGLRAYGLEWVEPPAAVAHPLDDGTAVVVERSISATMESMGADGPSYRRLVEPVACQWDKLAQMLLGPPRPPRYPVEFVRFGLIGLQPAASLARRTFRGERGRALFAGLAAHSILPLEAPLTASFAVVLAALAHRVGWPLARGGSQRIAASMEARLKSLGGEVLTGHRVTKLSSLRPSDAVLLDVSPRQLVELAGPELPAAYRRQLAGYRYGAGVFKIDYALDAPVPWTAPGCRRAATVHVGGTLDEIVEAEAAVGRGEHPAKPFVFVAQQSLFDDSRAPLGKHTLWAYCHVPNGSTVDMTAAIEGQIERFAPGFRSLVLARSTRTAAGFEQYDANYIGGDIVGGIQDWRQFFTRPVARLVPYTTPVRGLYLCSSSTPPGGGVHGMCGYFAARAALRGGRWY